MSGLTSPTARCRTHRSAAEVMGIPASVSGVPIGRGSRWAASTSVATVDRALDELGQASETGRTFAPQATPPVVGSHDRRRGHTDRPTSRHWHPRYRPSPPGLERPRRRPDDGTHGRRGRRRARRRPRPPASGRDGPVVWKLRLEDVADGGQTPGRLDDGAPSRLAVTGSPSGRKRGLTKSARSSRRHASRPRRAAPGPPRSGRPGGSRSGASRPTLRDASPSRHPTPAAVG